MYTSITSTVFIDQKWLIVYPKVCTSISCLSSVLFLFTLLFMAMRWWNQLFQSKIGRGMEHGVPRRARKPKAPWMVGVSVQKRPRSQKHAWESTLIYQTISYPYGSQWHKISTRCTALWHCSHKLWIWHNNIFELWWLVWRLLRFLSLKQVPTEV